MSNLPQITQLEFSNPEEEDKPTRSNVHETYDWDFDTGDFRLKDGKLVKLTGNGYVKCWIQKALLTMKDTLIYAGTDYGSDHRTLIGRNFHPDFEKAEYARMITEALMINDAITGVSNFTFSQSGSWLIVTFSVNSIYGTVQQQAVI